MIEDDQSEERVMLRTWTKKRFLFKSSAMTLNYESEGAAEGED
jgi:hypothetical protein